MEPKTTDLTAISRRLVELDAMTFMINQEIQMCFSDLPHLSLHELITFRTTLMAHCGGVFSSHYLQHRLDHAVENMKTVLENAYSLTLNQKDPQ